MDRRTFNQVLAGAATTSLLGGCATMGRSSGKIVLYQSVDETLTQWDVDVEAATLTRRGSIKLPSTMQYAWPHPSHRYLYASTSDQATDNKIHRLCALTVGTDGALSMHGEPATLAIRPIHNSVDATGAYALTAYNNPARGTVHHINADGSLGSLIMQPVGLDFGIFAHQIRTTPTNHSVVLVTRGVSATATKPEDPGALRLFRFQEGQLSPLQVIQVGGRGGLGYGPRHLDFHPVQPWVYVSLERENQLHMHRRTGDTFVPEPDFIKVTTVEDSSNPALTLAGPIHVHPAGHTVYVSNRASNTVAYQGKQVFAGGQNSIGVFSINPHTGEPTAIQHADPQSFHVRTFTIDPSGRLLIAASTVEMLVREGDTVRHVAGGLTVFRIAADGRLSFVRKYDVEIPAPAQQLWIGAMALPT
jgi:6-phosphogluconolactonase (cycloisomerase 2 family)